MSEPLQDITSLHKQIASYRASLRVYAERKSEHISPTNIPLQLSVDEERLHQQLADVEAQLTGLFQQQVTWRVYVERAQWQQITQALENISHDTLDNSYRASLPGTVSPYPWGAPHTV